MSNTINGKWIEFKSKEGQKILIAMSSISIIEDVGDGIHCNIKIDGYQWWYTAIAKYSEVVYAYTNLRSISFL